jgi:hypothetical protein
VARDPTAAMNARRFPPPWTVEEREACLVVRDHNGQQLAYVYFEEEPGRRSSKVMRASSDVRFWGQSGDRRDIVQCLLLTQSGHAQRANRL